MDQGTAFRLYKEGEPVSLIIDGRRVDDVRVTGLKAPVAVDLYLPTPIGEPDRRLRVALDRVELAP
jgi:hypothetical protein